MKKFLVFLFGLLCGAAVVFFALTPKQKVLQYIGLEKEQPVVEDIVIEEDDVIEGDDALENVETPAVSETQTATEPTEEKSAESVPAAEIVPAEPVEQPKPEKIDTTHGNHGVAAVVNGEEITVDEIRYTYDVNPQIKGNYSFKDFYNKAVKIYVDGKLVYDAAVASRIPETEEYAKQVELMKQDIARKVFIEKTLERSIKDENVKKLYDEYKKKFVSEKEVKGKHILVDSEDVAKEVIKQLDEGVDFDDLAAYYSKELADLGWFTKDKMIPEFGEAAFSIKQGTYSKEPVHTQYGYHIIYIEDIRDSKPATYEEIAPQLKQMMTQKVMETIYSSIKNGVNITIYDYDGNVMDPQAEDKENSEAEKTAAGEEVSK